jgi:hypothetical protein
MKTMASCLGLLAALSMTSAEAVNQEIRALFQPDPSQPNKNVFVNKTPNSGYCASYPEECTAQNMFSIQIPVRFNSARALIPGDSLALKAPANWRQLTVTNQVTRETETVEVRIIGIGSQFVLSRPAAELVGVTDILEGHQKLWTNSSWVYAPSPCRYSGIGAFTPATYRFFWKTPVEATCTKFAAYRIPSMYFDTLDFAYELRTPNPLGMSSGLYTGALTYTLGPGGDFQMGAIMGPDDGSLTLDFVLDVQHTLKVDLPPGGNKVVLEPAGGWQRWMESGHKPTRIYREQTFNISASSRFKVMMLCDAFGFNPCKMQGGRGGAQLLVAINMPPGISGPPGWPPGPVHLTNNVWRGPFQPEQYVDRKPGTLLFEMDKYSIITELQSGQAATYRAAVTIIWDSEV